MKFVKILNNNAAICLDENGNELIATGCGLAFQKKPKDFVPKEKIEKIFAPSDSLIKNKLTEMVAQIPYEYIVITEKILSIATNEFGKKLNDSVYVTLTDHIYGAVCRYKEGIKLKCALLWDIKRLYNDEYLIGMRALEIINEAMGERFDENEAGFIALHLINGGLESGNAADITKIISEILQIVKYDLRISYQENSLTYDRFVSHVKTLAERIASGKSSDDCDEKILTAIKTSYPKSFSTCEKVAAAVFKQYDYKMSPDDKTYLAIHIERIRSN